MRLRNVLVVKYCGYKMIVIRLRDRCCERFNCKTFKNSKVLTNIVLRKTCFAAKTNYSNCVFLTCSSRDGVSCEGVEPISRFVQLYIDKQKRLTSLGRQLNVALGIPMFINLVLTLDMKAYC